MGPLSKSLRKKRTLKLRTSLQTVGLPKPSSPASEFMSRPERSLISPTLISNNPVVFLL